MIDLKDNVIANLVSDERNGSTARALAGRALHTVQDFYAHSNWVNSPEPGNTGPNTVLGRTAMTRLPLIAQTCVDDMWDGTLTAFGLTDITTGYFSLQPASEPPPGKCSHGKFLGAGINKDLPERPFFTPAHDNAVTSTRDFIEQILNARGVAGNDDAIMAFMDVQGTLGFVVDDTGSMGSTIAGVRSTITSIINAVSSQEKKPSNYLLERFGDPSVGTPIVSPVPGVILSAVSAISPAGGGDCPELSQAGLLAALGKAMRRSTLFLYTDASAKDSARVGSVIALANEKKTIINNILTGSCSPIDPAYLEAAQRTGGQTFRISPYETSKLFSVIAPMLSGDLQPLRIIFDSITSERRYAVPVDSTVRRVMFSVALASGMQINVIRPSGEVVAAGDPDDLITTLSTGKIITVETPTPGMWQLQLQGTGTVAASVFGNSDLEFGDFAFVALSGRDLHEGLFPIFGQPVAGEEQLAKARLYGEYGSAEFQIGDLAGEPMMPLNMVLGGHPDVASDEYIGEAVLPEQSFRIYARGVDVNGYEFIRAYPPSFRLQTVKVEPNPDPAYLARGTATEVTFTVTNVGTRGSFRILVSDEQRFVTTYAPTFLVLEAGASAMVKVTVNVPEDTDLASDTVTLVVQDTSTPQRSNSAVRVVPIASLDTDGDGIPDAADACPASDVNPTLVLNGCGTGVTNTLDANGCTLADHFGAVGSSAKNHGEYVAVVTRFVNRLVDENLIETNKKGAVISCAARIH